MPQSDDEYGLEPAKKVAAGTAVADDYGLQDQADDKAAPPAAEEKKEPGTWDKLKSAVVESNPGLKALSAVSSGIGKAGDWLQGKSDQAHMEDLSAAAHGGSPGGTGASLYDLAARTARMGAGATSPENVAIGAGAIAAPEIVGPALIAHGGYGLAKGVGDIMEHGANPENTEQALTSGAEMAGGGAATGEIGARGGIGNTITGKVADKVARGTPITEEGKIAAAVEQAKAVKKPSMTETEYAQKVQDAVPELQRIAQDNKGAIKTPRTAVQAINNRISQLEAPISQHLRTLDAPEDMIHPDEYQGPINDAIDAELAKSKGNHTPAEIDKAKKTVMDFVGDQPKTLSEIENNRRRLNDDAQGYYNSNTAGKRSIDVSDATARAQRAAANKIRDVLYGDGQTPGHLEKAGVQIQDTNGQPVDLRTMRQKVGNLMDIRDHFEDSITKAEETGDWKPFNKLFTGPSLAAGGLGLVGGAMLGHPLLGTLAGEGVKAWGDYLRTKNPNLNVQKMFRNLENTTPRGSMEVATKAPTTQYQHAIGPQIPQHMEPIGPAEAPKPFALDNQAKPNPNQGAMWEQQIGAPPEITWGGPRDPYKHPIGPAAAQESPMEPIHGEQMRIPSMEQEYFAGEHNQPKGPKPMMEKPSNEGGKQEEEIPAIGGKGREFKISQKAEEMGAPRKNLGPEWEAGEAAHDLERNREILRNPKATAEEKRVASQRIEDAQKKSLDPKQSTIDKYYDDKTDTWSPEREALHQSIADEALKGKTPPKDRPPEAIITVGGTASGKTTLTKTILGDDANRVNVDTDANKLKIPEYADLKKTDPKRAAARVHDESKAISRRIVQQAAKKGLDFIYDTSTGGGGDALFGKLKDLGYKVRMVYADLPTDEALARSRKRALESKDPINKGRFVPDDVVRQKHQQAAQAFQGYTKSPNIDEVHAFDTSERTPKQFYRKVEGNEEILDRELHDRVAEKAKNEVGTSKK